MSGDVNKHFPDPLDVILLADGRSVQLDKRFRYFCEDGTVVNVPKGFISDGATIPRFFWRLIGPPLTGDYRRAAIVHDYLYRMAILPRATADAIFIEAMQHDGVGKIKRGVIWAAVRSFGWAFWKHR